jgi:hypothetical protein
LLGYQGQILLSHPRQHMTCQDWTAYCQTALMLLQLAVPCQGWMGRCCQHQCCSSSLTCYEPNHLLSKGYCSQTAAAAAAAGCIAATMLAANCLGAVVQQTAPSALVPAALAPHNLLAA